MEKRWERWRDRHQKESDPEGIKEGRNGLQEQLV